MKFMSYILALSMLFGIVQNAFVCAMESGQSQSAAKWFSVPQGEEYKYFTKNGILYWGLSDENKYVVGAKSWARFATSDEINIIEELNRQQDELKEKLKNRWIQCTSTTFFNKEVEAYAIFNEKYYIKLKETEFVREATESEEKEIRNIIDKFEPLLESLGKEFNVVELHSPNPLYASLLSIGSAGLIATICGHFSGLMKTKNGLLLTICGLAAYAGYNYLCHHFSSKEETAKNTVKSSATAVSKTVSASSDKPTSEEVVVQSNSDDQYKEEDKVEEYSPVSSEVSQEAIKHNVGSSSSLEEENKKITYAKKYGKATPFTQPGFNPQNARNNLRKTEQK
jgi:hypothetical protein